MAKNLFLIVLLPLGVWAQNLTIRGEVLSAEDQKPLSSVLVSSSQSENVIFTDDQGIFQVTSNLKDSLILNFQLVGRKSQSITLLPEVRQTFIQVLLESSENELETIKVIAKTANDFGRSHLRAIEGTSIYESKKTEVILLKDISANLSTNNSRQVYAKITGLNIWESDGAGLQLGIGGRGLSPNRTANFNTRQNGYDISADALGYPETYYTPPTEALKKIEVIRGASSLQYGTQFGGMLNFVFNKGPEDKKIEFSTRQTVGSWNYLGSFNSLGGTVGKLNYFVFYQHKKGDGWRPNSSFQQNNVYLDLTYHFSENFKAEFNYTYSDYLAQQAGGLTDAMFAQNPRQSVRERNWFDVNWNLASLTFDWKLSDRTTLNSRTFVLDASRASLGNLERINVADLGGNRTLISGNFDNIGNETRLLTRYDLGTQYGAFLIGGRVYRGKSSAIQGEGSDGVGPDFVLLNPEYPENSDYLFPNTNVALFAENIFNLSDKLSITPGLRFEYINTQSEGYYRQRVFDFAGNLISDLKVEESQSRERSFVIGGIGLSYRASEEQEVYANFSQNYRAINFSDLRIVNPNFAVDQEIKDETGFTADLGFRGKKGNYFSYDLTAFYVAYNDRIGQILRADQPPLYLDYRLRTNVSDARNFGLEIFSEFDFLKWRKQNSDYSLSAYLNAAYVNARYDESENTAVSGNKVEMVPPVMLRTGLSFKARNWGSSLQWNYIAEHFTDATNAIRTSTAVEGLIPSYSVMDISSFYSFSKFKLELSVNNVLNEFYFTRRAEAYPGPGIIPSDGRGVYLSLQAKL
ncbi:TonB-dependent receptor family protein [Jiulongibacter sp. NS-SX5]|uniref:TonB-dependent receptor family protein n=1 Tax=Jiulongibacter sp. NS-SX5 TaxID=3463854 RepID=UPI00405A3CA6